MGSIELRLRYAFIISILIFTLLVENSQQQISYSLAWGKRKENDATALFEGVPKEGDMNLIVKKYSLLDRWRSPVLDDVLRNENERSRKNGISVGYSTFQVPSVRELIETIITRGNYCYAAIPLVKSQRENLNEPIQEPFGVDDLDLQVETWSDNIIGHCSNVYQIESRDMKTRLQAEKALCEEIKFVIHLSIEAFIVPLCGPKNVNLARILNNFTQNDNRLQFFKFSLRIPMWNNQRDDELYDPDDLSFDTWRWWTNLRDLCEESRNLCIALELTADLPPQELIDRWYSEPIRCIILTTSLFLSNKSGFPVLSKAHQKCLMKFMRLKIDVLIEGPNRHEHGIDKYKDYIVYLFNNNKEPGHTALNDFTKGYEDHLQIPLQPLADNLESSVYEAFEKDPFKYAQYKVAIAQALVDRVPDTQKDSIETVIMVVGAGRGPLVQQALQASRETDRKIKLYAIEKNPNAINTLLYLKKKEWQDKVEVVSIDMRDWKTTVKADIMVSELLGSFGCNELSPECLYGAQHLLKENGISIPQKYRSFIAPIQSYKNYCQAKKLFPDTKYPHEVPYVVLLQNHYVIDQPKPIFEYIHPAIDTDQMDTNRFATAEFKASIDCTLHGLAGYFDCNLYKDVTLSIVPETHSPGMFSWFSMYFPIYNPIHLKANDSVEINFWRLKTHKHVWYEWCVVRPEASKICNPNGRTYAIGLY